MINIKIEHRCAGQENLDYNYTANSKLYIYPENEGDYFEYDDSNPIGLIYSPYIQNNISPRITISGDFFTPSRGEIYETNDEEEYNIVINVNYDPLFPSGEEPGDNNSSVEIPMSFSFTVKSYKSGTNTEVYDEYKVDTCYYVKRYDEENYIYLSYYTDYEFNGDVYTYTKESTYGVPLAITDYKLSEFKGIKNNESLTGSKENITYPFYAYYVDNNFKVIIDSKGIDRSQVVVQNPNITSIKYELPYEYNYPNTTLLLEALTSNDDYVFDYWEVNGEKYSTDNKLSYDVDQDTTIYCYFKEKPLIVEGKIVTNEDIYNVSKYIYGVNNNQCPTKSFILDNGYDAIKLNNEYQDNQCVVFNDLKYKRIFDNIKLINDCGVTLDAFGIYFAYDEPNDSNTYDFLSYEFEDDVIKKNTTTTLSKKTLDISKIGDYRNKTMYFGFWSKKWEGSKRSFTFNINGKIFKTEDMSHAHVGKTDSGETISVIDFLREYYNNVIITITQN